MKELLFKDDKYKMNWIRPDFEYAHIKCPKELSYNVTNRQEDDLIYTEIEFTNVSKKPFFTNSETIRIAFPVPDIYEDSATCLKSRCHTHIFCGDNVGYVMALRMGGEAPHLGMVITEGGLAAYSVERNPAKSSNDRGCFYLHPSPMEFARGETKKICWTIFPHQGKEDFQKKLSELSRYVKAEADQYVLFPGEKINITITPSFDAREITVDGKPVTAVDGKYIVEFEANEKGEKTFHIHADDVHTWLRILVHERLDVLALNRCRFIMDKQQYHGSIEALKGAYLAYDNEDKAFVYTHKGDYNGARERVCMGLLMSKYLQYAKEPHADMEASLKEYIEYVKREIVDLETGYVCNDMEMDGSYKRLYNFSWFAIFFIELYHQYKDKNYLTWTCQIIRKFYEEGGVNFYPIELPIVILDNALKNAGMSDERAEMKTLFTKHADRIAETGRNYPPSEVKFEQSIIAPAADILLETYLITNDKKYLAKAKEQLQVLELFNGEQPDYHLYETAIRHWDGYWFGKRKLFGDTFPHYWSALTGLVYKKYAKITNDEAYMKKAEASLRGVLPMIFPDGSASCAYLYPSFINGVRAGFYEPYANDQDWALYYYLRETLF